MRSARRHERLIARPHRRPDLQVGRFRLVRGVRRQPLLEIGLTRGLFVREEWLSRRRDACRLLYVSDIHLRRGRSDTLCRQIVDAAGRSGPDVILLGGDLVDGRSELTRLGDLVGTLRGIAPVLAVGGNHDRAVGLRRVRDAVVATGGQWIHDSVARLSHGGRAITVAGPDAGLPPLARATAERASGTPVRVLCAHNPRVWKRSRHAGYDLVLAGHLHGCQVVACEYRGRLFPGAFFYRYCVVRHHSGMSRLVVSRGVSDLLPIRWRCPREVVLCHV